MAAACVGGGAEGTQASGEPPHVLEQEGGHIHAQGAAP